MDRRERPNDLHYQEIGLVTWNVNHMSNYDISKLLANIKKELAAFSVDDFYNVMARTEAMLSALLTDQDIQNCMANLDTYATSAYPQDPAFKTKFARIQGCVAKTHRGNDECEGLFPTFDESGLS